MVPISEVTHSACTDPGRSNSCTHTHTRRERPPETVARAAVVAPPSRLHPPARRGVEREYRQRLLRRNAVPSVDVAVRRRPGLSASSDAAGAAVQGVAGVAP